MDRKKVKFLALGLGIVCTMGFLLAVGINRPGGFVYFLTVSEFLNDPSHANRDVRVNGKVADGTIVRKAGGLDVSFVVTDGKSRLPVEYHGVIPDTFMDGADVVVEGRLRDDSTFVADNLLAKCPSKYEAAAKRGEENPHQQPPQD